MIVKDATAELNALMEEMTKQGVKIKYKKNSWFKLGKNFTTTIGKSIFVPDDWDQFTDLQKLSTLTHEMVHVKQYKRFTLPGFLFLYLLVFLPIGLSFFRYLFEREAYLIGFKKILEYKSDPITKATLIKSGTENMVGKNYGFAWPFAKYVKGWFEKNLLP